MSLASLRGMTLPPMLELAGIKLLLIFVFRGVLVRNVGNGLGASENLGHAWERSPFSDDDPPAMHELRQAVSTTQRTPIAGVGFQTLGKKIAVVGK